MQHCTVTVVTMRRDLQSVILCLCWLVRHLQSAFGSDSVLVECSVSFRVIITGVMTISSSLLLFLNALAMSPVFP